MKLTVTLLDVVKVKPEVRVGQIYYMDDDKTRLFMVCNTSGGRNPKYSLIELIDGVTWNGLYDNLEDVFESENFTLLENFELTIRS